MVLSDKQTNGFEMSVSANNAAIRCESVTKSYGATIALKGIDLEIQKGELFGLIGPDGSGKSSLFRILCTLLLADSGDAWVDSFNVVKDYREIRKRIGYMPGRFSLYQDLSVEENLTFFASVYGTTIQENYHQVEEIYRQIEPFKTRKAGELSGGMKQKLALSCALIHKPTVLFLDEPTTGVDPVSRKEFWQMLKRLKKDGITIMVSTPYMDEAGKCDRIALMNDGKFLMIDTPSNIVGGFSETLLAVVGTDMPKLLADVRKISYVKRCFAFGDTHHVVIENWNNDHENVQDTDSSVLLKKDLMEMGHTDLEVYGIEPGIEDCFMALVKEK